MIQTIVSTCEDASLGRILLAVKNLLFLIQIIVPLMLIIWGSFALFQLMQNPDMKNGVKNIVNKFIAAFVIFMIPVLLNVVFSLVGESTDFSSCWNNASDFVNNNTTYIPINEKDKQTIINSSDDYEPGDKRSTNDNSNGSSKSSNKTSPSAANKVVFIGDSRTVQIYAYLTGDWNGANYSSGGVHVVGNDVFVAQSGQGLSWMKSTGIPAASPYFGSGTAIVILMGVNDAYNINNYISFLNSNVRNWTSNGSTVYYSAVTPCSGSYNSLNSNIVSFNNQLSSNLPNGVHWIDTYNYLMSSGYNTTDGLHYDQNTSNKIYNYIKSNV